MRSCVSKIQDFFCNNCLFYENKCHTKIIIRKGLPSGTVNQKIKNSSFGNPNEKRKLLSKYLNRKESLGDRLSRLNGTKLIDFTEILDLIEEK